MAETDMREVVERLRAEHSQVLRELSQFDSVMDELLEHLECLAEASRHLDLKARSIVESTDREKVRAVQARANRVNARCTQILIAFREAHHAVQAWNITDARRRSTESDGSQSGIRYS